MSDKRWRGESWVQGEDAENQELMAALSETWTPTGCEKWCRSQIQRPAAAEKEESCFEIHSPYCKIKDKLGTIAALLFWNDALLDKSNG